MHNPDKPSDFTSAHDAAVAEGCATGQPAVAHGRGRYHRWLKQLAIRPLSARHRGEILTHLLALRPRDRYLRFGYYASDVQIGRYVEILNFERDALHGMFSRDMRLVAFSHVALPACWEHTHVPNWRDGRGTRVAEFGVSVLAQMRGQGMGKRLYAHAVQEAQARGMDALVIHALSENSAMLSIVGQHGACVVKEGVDAEACQHLKPAGWGQRLEHRLQNQLTRACHVVLSRWQVGRDLLCVR